MGMFDLHTNIQSMINIGVNGFGRKYVQKDCFHISKSCIIRGIIMNLNEFKPKYSFGRFQCAIVVEKMLETRTDGKYWRKFFQRVYQDASWLASMPSGKSPKRRATDFLRNERLEQVDARIPDDTKDNIDFKTHVKNTIVTIFRAKVERPTPGYKNLCKTNRSKIAPWKCKEAHGIFVPFDERLSYKEEMKWALYDVFHGNIEPVVAGLNKVIEDGCYHEVDKLFFRMNRNMKRVDTNMLVTILKITMEHKDKFKRWDRFMKRVTYTMNERKEDVFEKLYGFPFEKLL